MCQNPGKYSIFPQKDAKSGRPKNSRSCHHPSHPHLTPSYCLSRRVSQEHPAGVPRLFLKFICLCLSRMDEAAPLSRFLGCHHGMGEHVQEGTTYRHLEHDMRDSLIKACWNAYLEKAQGATQPGATRLRASERKSASQRVSERTSENLSKISENFSKNSEKPLKTSENLSKISENPPSQRPSQRQISSQRLSVLLPLLCCPLTSLRLITRMSAPMPVLCTKLHFNACFQEVLNLGHF